MKEDCLLPLFQIQECAYLKPLVLFGKTYEPPLVCRRLIYLSYAAMYDLSRAA